MTRWLLGLVLILSACVYAKPQKDQIDESPQYIGDLFVDALYSGDFSELEQHFDRELFGKKILSYFGNPNGLPPEFEGALGSVFSLNVIFGKAVEGFDPEEMEAKVVGIDKRGDYLVPIVRVLHLGEPANYIELRLLKKSGKLFIEDIFVLANAQLLSKSFGQTLSMIHGEGYLISDGISDEKSRNKVIDLVRKAKQEETLGNNSAAYETMKKLPSTILADGTVHLVLVAIASHLDEQIYRTELSSFANKHGNDPRYAFLLIDHYAFTQEHDKALKNIDLLLDRYKHDAALITIKAGIYLEQGDYVKAEAAVAQALAYEIDYEKCYRMGISIALAQQEHGSTLKWLKAYEQQFDYEFAAEYFLEQEPYQRFIKSKEYKDWMKAKQ